MVEEITTNYERVLRMIADHDCLPCRQCGEVHVPWRSTANPILAPQWSGEDGHAFYQMTPAEFARRALHDGKAGA